MKAVEPKNIAEKGKGEYSSIEHLVNTKMLKASKNLKNIDLSKLNKFSV
jgi:hypothetical protein